MRKSRMTSVFLVSRRFIRALRLVVLLPFAALLMSCQSLWDPWLRVHSTVVCYTLNDTPEEMPFNSTLGGIWGVGDTFWVMGSGKTEDGAGIAKWDGESKLIAESLPRLKVGLSALWGSDKEPIWAVGGSSVEMKDMQPATSQGIILKRTAGTTATWALDPLTNISHLKAVHGTGELNVWAVGERGTILNFRQPTSGDPAWAKPAWKDPATESFLAQNFNFEGVFVVSESEVWVVGGKLSTTVQVGSFDTVAPGVILHLTRDAAGWQADESKDLAAQPISPSQPLFGIWGNRADNIWVVGGQGVVLTWDGASWTPQDQFTQSNLRHINGHTNGAVLWTGDMEGQLFRRTALGWTRQIASNKTPTIVDLWPGPAGDVWFTTFGGGLQHCTPTTD